MFAALLSFVGKLAVMMCLSQRHSETVNVSIVGSIGPSLSSPIPRYNHRIRHPKKRWLARRHHPQCDTRPRNHLGRIQSRYPYLGLQEKDSQIVTSYSEYRHSPGTAFDEDGADLSPG